MHRHPLPINGKTMRRIPSSPISVHKQQETCYSYTRTESDSDSKPAQTTPTTRYQTKKKWGETKGACASVRQTLAPLEQLYVKSRCGTAALFFAQLSSNKLLDNIAMGIQVKQPGALEAQRNSF